jgi:LemA protein
MNLALWIPVGIVAFLVLFFVFVYNSFVRLRNEVDNSFSQIDVQLKRRNDLIPNLIETVKGYVKHEKELLENITKARSAIMNAPTTKARAEASNMMSDTLKSLFAVAENYPKLQANENFKHLQEELVATEDKISYSRQHYNDTVMVYNTKLESFPSNIVGRMFSFVKRELFAASDTERQPVKVSF